MKKTLTDKILRALFYISISISISHGFFEVGKIIYFCNFLIFYKIFIMGIIAVVLFKILNVMISVIKDEVIDIIIIYKGKKNNG